MNETDLQKQLVKEAFSNKQLPSFGLLEGGAAEAGVNVVRNYLWKVAGYLVAEKFPIGTAQNLKYEVRSKKAALVMLYRLWSAFTKNLRHLLTARGESAVRLTKLGTFRRTKDSESGLLRFSFHASLELSKQLRCDLVEEKGDSTSAKALDWTRIAESAQVVSADLARSLVQALFAMALARSRDGCPVSLNVRVGCLTMANGELKYTSHSFGNR